MRGKRKKSRNRMKVKARKKVTVRVVPGLLAGVIGCATLVALSYLYINGRCDDLEKKIIGLEKQREEIRREVVNEEYKWSRMTSPPNMEKLLKRHSLVMTLPDKDDVIRVQLDDTRVTQLAYHNSGRVHD